MENPACCWKKNAEGKAHGDFPMPDKKKEATPIDRRWFPKIEQLTIEDGRIGYNDPLLETQLDMNISTAVGKSDEQSVKLSGRGRLQKEQFTMDVEGVPYWTYGIPKRPFLLKSKVNMAKPGQRFRPLWLIR
ncbi:MAG: hypothetical protein ACXW1Z_23575 [Methylobacter sp.]